MPLLAWLPDPIEWYFRPTPGRTNFTLFPWAGFVFAGAAVGVVIDGLQARRTRQAPPGDARRRGRPAGVAGARSVVPAALCTPSSEYWTTSASFFFLRVGLLTLLLPLGYLWEHAPLSA